MLFGVVLLYPYFTDDTFRARISLEWNSTSDSVSPDVTVLMVPEKGYDTLFAEVLGETTWKEVAGLFRTKAGIAVFPAGDILTITKRGDSVVRTSLHHYLSRISGTEITIRRSGKGWRLQRIPLILSEQTMIKTFVVQDEFARDFPEFYEMIRRAMQWDWGILHHLKPGDSISFMIRGIFDSNILIDLSALVGISVKNVRYGAFTLLKPPGCPACEFYVTSGEMFMSPPGFFRAPLNAGRITSHFGIRDDPFNEETSMHTGIDVKAELGSLVHAARSGVITETGWKRGYGNTIIIRHKDGIKTLYAHLQSIYVASGSSVGMGDIIGTVGNSGRSTGSHLHFGVYRESKAVDPLTFTYERLWLPPFDIADRFREGTIEKAIVLEENLNHNKSLFIPETYAGFEVR
jgi:hypothetical protein